MSQNDSKDIEKEKTVLKKCQKDLTESYFALIERILKRYPTAPAAKDKIFEDLKMSEIVSLDQHSAQQKWEIICETTKKYEIDNFALIQKIEEIQRLKGIEIS
ncbi:hypothetical protein RFI_37886 [Reticulomyxa filosa]|uniref:Uncharacterized protein n=1 Tax=Reticulomyxa filosa TaxID=46433 RepID=X6LDY5_RETFI|nr:hypothetical protein RFI_37886 [Reticulomyxa filosa]|eukprot:ETN99585.1 hypothetical protein RFI_37886 [Reticulomyxa filosa]